MSFRKTRKYVPIIYGIIVTLFMLTAYGLKLIESFNENGITYLLEIPKAFTDWYDNPVAFFFTYFIGYAML